MPEAPSSEAAGLLVDMDGTLVDTADANFAAYAAALGEAGVALDRETFDRVAHGRHWRQFLPPLLQAVAAQPAAISARKQALYPQMIGLTRLNRPLATLIASARPAMRTGLVTTASRPSVAAVLAAHDLGSLFDVVVTGDDVAAPKPAPDAYLLAARQLGLEPGRCLAVEDSEIGVESARAAGMAVLALQGAMFSARTGSAG